MRGYQPGRFSFNVKGGRCEACQGDGLVKIEMHFLPDVYVTCDVCKGRRYNRETLDVHYKGMSIAAVLDMTVREALAFFDAVPVIKSKLATLDDVGLDYIRLGQSATTLSGGEAQRVKLATELSRRATGRTFYILDEPTTGLHFADIQRLLDVLNKLVDQGNTVVIIEHNLDVVKTADWVIDLGPEGGDEGGRVVATGTPEELARRAERLVYRAILETAAHGFLTDAADQDRLHDRSGEQQHRGARSPRGGRPRRGAPQFLPRHARRARGRHSSHPRRRGALGPTGRHPARPARPEDPARDVRLRRRRHASTSSPAGRSPCARIRWKGPPSGRRSRIPNTCETCAPATRSGWTTA